MPKAYLPDFSGEGMATNLLEAQHWCTETGTEGRHQRSGSVGGMSFFALLIDPIAIYGDLLRISCNVASPHF